MARRASGQVVEREGTRGAIYALRFYANGERRYETLGTSEDGWNRRRAEDELAAVMAAVRAGTWKPRVAEVIAETTDHNPTFHEFASEWLANREPELRPKTVTDYRWALSHHLLPFFAEQRVAAITPADVDRYKAAKLTEGRIAGAQINKTLRLFAQILDVAGEYGLLTAANPARGRRRRVKATRPQRTWVEPEQLMALLEVASGRLRPVLATLAGAGLRVGEAMALDWRDVNLATGVLTVGESKTAAGAGREVDMPGGLLDALKEHKAQSDRTAPGDPVFTARPVNGLLNRQSDGNVRGSLKVAIKHANARLDELGIEPISERVTPHSLRRTYASLRGALRDDPVYIAEQLGHEDATFTFRVYQKAVKRRGRLSGNYLAAFDQALEWALMGTNAVSAPDAAPTPPMAPTRQTALASRKPAGRS